MITGEHVVYQSGHPARKSLCTRLSFLARASTEFPTRCKPWDSRKFYLQPALDSRSPSKECSQWWTLKNNASLKWANPCGLLGSRKTLTVLPSTNRRHHRDGQNGKRFALRQLYLGSPMNSTLWTTLFAVLMAGVIVVMLTILVGFVTDTAIGARRDRRPWLARFRLFCLAMQRNQTSTRFRRPAPANGPGAGCLKQTSCTCSEKTLGRQVTARGHF